jgi:16S rRNA C967 or C1407 C5-methylase (RsmB/RsmF family)/NOL1/NOP2/fmu family ribosome biogenesis protein
LSGFIVERYHNILDDVPSFLRAVEEPLCGVAWIHPLRAREGVVRDWFQFRGVQVQSVPWYPGAFRVPPDVSLGHSVPYVAGWFCVQEEVALTAVKALAPEAGEAILDLCASPGGKTAQISFAVGARGLVVANEKSWQRLTPLASRVDSLALNNVVVTHSDGMATTLAPAGFDRVLADVPCSGEGTLRKHVHGVQPVGDRLQRILPVMQKCLLRRALRLTKPGGVLVYSTCTFNPEENEAVLDEALGDLGDVEPFEISGFHSRPGLSHWKGKHFRRDVSFAKRFYPQHNNTGGFFVARIRRSYVPFWREKEPKIAEPHGFVELLGDDRERLCCWLEKRYGVAPAVWSDVRFVQKAQIIRMISQGVAFPNERVSLAGVSAFEKTTKGFLPTAHGAQIIGVHANRAIISLQEGVELESYLSGKNVRLSQCPEVVGIVLVKYGDFVLGKGVVVDGVLESHLPKAIRFTL